MINKKKKEWYDLFSGQPNPFSEPVREIDEKLLTLRNELEELKGNLSPDKINAIIKVVDDTAEPLSGLRSRLNTLEITLAQTPEKAITQTLLRGRITSLQIVVYGAILPLLVLIITYLLFK